VDFTHEAGYATARDLLTRAHPDALFCANDMIALGALRALREVDLGVPDAVAVAGMDDTDLAALSVPSLTTVSLGSAERGHLAASLMFERLADPSLAPRRRTVAPSLIIRESTAPSRARDRKL
jgi:LacI family transcriptional regulator